MQSLENAVFISDLHLTEDRPDCTRAFFQFLDYLPSSTDALFILGDFFEYWVGDDVASFISTEVASKLSETLEKKKIQGYFIAGNRDFTIGKAYCKTANLTQLDEQTIFKIAGKSVLVSHGDEFCTDDLCYQRFRKIIRNPIILKTLLALPKKYRLSIADKLRQKSQRKFLKNPVYIDVNKQSVEDTIIKLKIDFCVHGHTHMADIHTHFQDKQRMVLGDWHKYGWFGAIDNNGLALNRFDIKEPSFR